MKFINYLQSISEVSIYPLLALLLFFILFVALTVWAFKAKKSYISEVKNIPLSND